MRENYLLQLAIEMLESTNPYDNPVEEFNYSYIELRVKNDISLLGKVEDKLQNKHKSFRRDNPLERDYEVCYEAIAEAMVEYLENYKPQSFAFLQITKSKFSEWLKSIGDRYNISNQIVPYKLRVNSHEPDTAITLLKALHPRKRVTVDDIAKMMGISQRAVQKDLKKLDPSLNSDSESSHETPFRIGGQPVEVKIDTKKPDIGKATLYRTANTIHPIVLLENQMQVGTLLKSLAHSYYKEESYVCYTIGLDIWCQLSDYSKERVRIYYASEDEYLQSLIKELERALPNMKADGFQTERNMIDQLNGLSIEEMLTFALKGFGRRCNIVIKDNDGERIELTGYTLDSNLDSDGVIIYTATGANGEQVVFHEKDVLEIEL